MPPFSFPSILAYVLKLFNEFLHKYSYVGTREASTMIRIAPNCNSACRFAIHKVNSNKDFLESSLPLHTAVDGEVKIGSTAVEDTKFPAFARMSGASFPQKLLGKARPSEVRTLLTHNTLSVKDVRPTAERSFRPWLLG